MLEKWCDKMHNQNSETYKIFNFILKDKNIQFQAESIFNRDTLLFLWQIIQGEVADTFCLNEKQENLLIQSFIESDAIFDQDTPTCIRGNSHCIELAIERNIESIHYIHYIDSTLEKKIIHLSENSDFSINEDTCDLVKRIFEVAFSSIKHDIFSADFLSWEEFSEKQVNILVDELIRQHYLLHQESPDFLKENKRIALFSLEQDANCKEYISADLMGDLDVFKFFILNYELSNIEIKQFTLNMFSNFDVWKVAFENLEAYGSSYVLAHYKERFESLFYDSIFKFPKISTFRPIFDVIIEQEWIQEKNANPMNYENIFAKICSYLRNHEDISQISRLSFMTNMRILLGESRYSLLYSSMEKYSNIYHGNNQNMLELLEEPQNVISKFSALYISKCKEQFKKEALEKYYRLLYPYFILDEENPLIKKRMVYRSKKEQFKYLFEHHPNELSSFINFLKEKYKDSLDEESIMNYILQFALFDNYKLDMFESEPFKYQNYLKYKKTLKLIHRLNSNYIKWDGPEVANYQDLIQLDPTTLKYIYIGEKYTKYDLEEFQKYENHLDLFKRIKKDIVMEINHRKLDEDDVDEDYLSTLARDLPFTDQYFKFNPSNLEKFNMNEFFGIILNRGDGFTHSSFLRDDSYQNLYQFLVDNGAVWLTLFSVRRRTFDLKDYGFDEKGIVKFISDMNDITSLANIFGIDICHVKQLMLLSKMIDFVDQETLAVLGKDLILELINDMEYTNENESKIIDIAKSLVCSMVTRGKSTVPYIKGGLFNYKYSLYDSLDTDLLLSGIKTDACFRCDGNDNDFLHYCALNKNGFVIKITDSFDNFVARASGFRHGNCVFINQLRMIYDDTRGDGYTSGYSNEKNEIIETFKKACNDMIQISQQNENEENPIDYVFVNRCYCLSDYSFPVSGSVCRQIGLYPMDLVNDNWTEFIENTDNLRDYDGFDTDYGAYPILCIASSGEELISIEPESLHLVDTPAFYMRKRNPIIATDQFTQEMVLKVNQIKAIDTTLEEKSYKYINIEKDNILIMGDNWYIILKGDCLIEYCVLENDEFALTEFNTIHQAISSILSSLENDNLSVSDTDKLILKLIEEEIFNLSRVFDDEEKNGGGQQKELVLSMDFR